LLNDDRIAVVLADRPTASVIVRIETVLRQKKRGERMLRMALALGLIIMTVGATDATAQSKAGEQWTAPPPQRAHNAGFAVATVQWAVASCGGKMGDFFKESMSLFGKQHAQAFNLGHEEGGEEMRKLAATKGKDLGCRVVDSLYGAKGESMADGWLR
jgi:hypothetical protein